MDQFHGRELLAEAVVVFPVGCGAATVKESGLGREGAAEGLEEYLETKFICLGAIDA